jgi:single-stranded DNA-specific DHH superfamily exonuclease
MAFAHGSGRSIGPFNLLEALESCHDVFLKFGGHKQAAGVTLEAARIPEMRRRLTAYANEAPEPAGSGATAPHRRTARPPGHLRAMCSSG